MNNKLILIFVLIFNSQISFAMSGLEEFMMEMQYKYEMSNSNKNAKQIHPEIECPKIFEKALKTWQANSKIQNDEFLLEGHMEKAFSEVEMQNMSTTNIHGVLGKIRGNNKISSGGFSYGGIPAFPHTYPECENYYLENVTIKNENGTTCRIIRFTDPKSQNWYSQKYCAENTKVFIHIENPSLNESSCFSGSDLVKCNH